MNPGKQQKFDYVPAVLRKILSKEENDLAMWQGIIDSPNSDKLSIRQAKGNISGTEGRIKEINAALLILNPPKEEKDESKN